MVDLHTHILPEIDDGSDGVDTAESQVSATEESKKISAGDFQPRHFLGRELIKSTTF